MTQMNEAYPHLANAPIVEAVIDCRVKLPSDFKLDVLQPLRTKLATDYPSFDEQQIVEQTIRQEAGRTAEFSARVSGIHGYRLSSNDRKNVVQLRRDGRSSNSQNVR